MNNKSQLATHLKNLKLSGILNNLDLRVLEAQTNQLAYSTFLMLSFSMNLRPGLPTNSIDYSRRPIWGYRKHWNLLTFHLIILSTLHKSKNWQPVTLWIKVKISFFLDQPELVKLIWPRPSVTKHAGNIFLYDFITFSSSSENSIWLTSTIKLKNY